MEQYIGIGIAAGAVVILLLWIIITYNRLVKKKLRIENNFSQIKIQCKKRFDLIPNLVETVKSSATLQKEILSAQNAQELATANEQLSKELGNVSISEKLQNELANIEKSITISRQIYNDSVMMYNRSRMMFPNSLIAALFRFRKAEFFEAADDNFKVSLNNTCSHCGAKNPGTAVKCSACGSRMLN